MRPEMADKEKGSLHDCSSDRVEKNIVAIGLDMGLIEFAREMISF